MPYHLFAVTAPGLEPLAEAELRAVGIRGAAEPGGVAWEGSLEEMYLANLRLRTASRILLRIGTFTARAFYELERHLNRVEWERFVAPGGSVRLRVTSGKSKLYHEGAIAERVLRAIGERVGGVTGAATAAAVDDEEPRGDSGAESATIGAAAQLFVIRFHRDRCTVSADSSGELLHRRGYRVAVAKAPLRETLAAAMLRAARWDERSPLLDPFCGAGTIPIEAALAARRIPPGLGSPDRRPRAYRFERWREHEPGIWDRVVAHAADEILDAAPARIIGSDRDEGAIAAAVANSERAGVAADVELERKPLSAVQPPDGPGLLVTNPPYGLRVGERGPLRNLYAALGRVARERLGGWTIALLGADPLLESQIGMDLDEVLRTRNGGIPVRLLVGSAGQRPDGA